jgi:biopolymer transport protein ExbD
MAASLGGGLGSQRGEMNLNADVNVTSLVDVMLVLLKSLVATRKPSGVYLQADTRVPYGEVVRVLAIIRGAGVQNVGLVAQEEESS